MHVEVEAEHMVLTKTKCEEFLCACIEHVAAWFSKYCNTKKQLLQLNNAICILKCKVSKQMKNIPVTETGSYTITSSTYFGIQCTKTQTYQTQI
jgi:hypothetical protein